MESSAQNNNDGEGGGGDDQAVIPVTVRQLEVLIRLSESLSKMRLHEVVQGQDIAEALRLFKVSTMVANAADSASVEASAASGSNGGKNGNSIMRAALPSREEMIRTESFLGSRIAIGNTMNKQRIVEEAASQGYDASIVTRAIAIMVRKGEMVERNQGRLYRRVK